MQLESHATPPAESPQLRYASLHRAIDRGLDADEVWSELAEVCLHLGRGEEAVRCVQRVRRDALRLALESKLVRAGLMAAAPATPADPANAADPAGVRRAASPARPAAGDDGPVTAGEWLGDALGYLCQQQLPWLVLGVAAAFPILAGFGGVAMLGATSGWLVALVACPAVCGLVVAAALLRRILLVSSAGSAEVPAVGDPVRLCVDACRGLADCGLVAGLLLGPCCFALSAGAPWPSALPGLLIGAFLLPMALGLRTVRGDFGALSPTNLLRGVQRTGVAYAGLWLVLLGLLAPTALALYALQHQPLWRQSMVLGPLVTVQAFFLARLLGTWFDAMRLELGAVLRAGGTASAVASGPGAAVRTSAEPLAADDLPPAAGQPVRPAALAHYATPPAQPRPRRRTAAPAAGVAKPAAAAPSGPAAPATARTIEGRAPAGRLADTPDLRHMPGATVVSGAERVRAGAAARRS